MRDFDTDIEYIDKDKTGPDERLIVDETRMTDLIRVMIPTKETRFGRAIDRKLAKRITRPHDGIGNCANCKGRFRIGKMHLHGKLCANCFKIHESVRRTVEMYEGSFYMKVISPGNIHFKLKCAEGHNWTIGMESRKAKNWCKVCKEDARVRK